jgi:membrane protease YdiL (CAAX protease family)
MRIAREYPVVLFFVLALALSWAVWIPATLLLSGTVSTAVVIVGSFGPAVAGALLTKAQGRSLRTWVADMARFRVGARWWLVALGLPVAAAAVGTVAFAAEFGPIDLSVLPNRIPMWLFGLVFVSLAGGGNEEPGWRGYALPHLQRDYSALTASLLIGVVWAVWHLPLFVLPGGMYAGKSFTLYVPFVVAFSVILTWLYNGSGGSVPAAMLLHAGINSASVLIPAPASVVSELSARPWHMKLRLAVFAAIAVALVLYYGPKTLSARGKRTLPEDGLASADAPPERGGLADD